MEFETLVNRSRTGDSAAYAALVEATHRMVYAIAHRVLQNHASALDALQETYLRAYRHLGELQDPAAFPGWLRRIAVTAAQDIARQERTTFLTSTGTPDVPVLDDLEDSWSDSQRRALARALLVLSPEERRLCDRHYHGGWTAARLAQDAGITELAMRKRLQRIRDRLRKDVEMSEQHAIAGQTIPRDLPAKILELLAKPTLVDLPENPVGKVTEILRAVFADYALIEVPEMIDLAEAKRLLGQDPLYIPEGKLHSVDAARILRYDLTLPLLMSTRYQGEPLRLVTAGKVYRNDGIDAGHLEAFHQFEAFFLDDAAHAGPWHFAGLVLKTVHALLPNCATRLMPTHYPICSQAWEMDVQVDGQWTELLGWGIYNTDILRYLGADPARHTAAGIGCGLERISCARYRIDDVRKVEDARV